MFMWYLARLMFKLFWRFQDFRANVVFFLDENQKRLGVGKYEE